MLTIRKPETSSTPKEASARRADLPALLVLGASAAFDADIPPVPALLDFPLP
jgi:hypothetical protein